MTWPTNDQRAQLRNVLQHHKLTAVGGGVVEADIIAALTPAAARPKPVTWAQLGMRDGHAYVRMNYEGPQHPPPPDVQRNLNLTPLYVAPVAAQALTDEQIDTILEWERLKWNASQPSTRGLAAAFARAIERAHGIALRE